MKRLIKRYVLKAQVDRESDEVNEGENCLCIIVPLFDQGICVCSDGIYLLNYCT